MLNAGYLLNPNSQNLRCNGLYWALAETENVQ